MYINDFKIIKKPILTAKTYQMMKAENTFVFSVAINSNKAAIKKAFERLFSVKVESVNIINSDPKQKRVGKYFGLTNSVKKAIIKLKDGETLNLFNEDIAPEKDKNSKISKFFDLSDTMSKKFVDEEAKGTKIEEIEDSIKEPKKSAPKAKKASSSATTKKVAAPTETEEPGKDE